MDNFRLNPKHRPKRSVDGFIPNTGSLESKSLSKVNDQDTDKTQLDSIRKKSDGFHSSNIGSQLDALPSLKPYTPNPEIIEKIKKPKKKHRISKKMVFRGLLVVFVVALLSGGLFFGKIWWNTHKILKGGGDSALALNSNVDPTLLSGEGDGRVNIMLLGKGGENHPGGDLTDSILIASIDPLGKEASLLSIPRDLYVKVPDYWSMKINAVYSSGKQRALSTNEEDTDAAEKAGIKLLENIIETNIGIPIHYYVMVNFDAFQQAVDAVDGVDINVKEPLYDYVQAWDNGGNPLIAAEGQQHFNGKKALLYTRSRSSSSDFARGERQREIVVGLKEKVMKMGTFSNPLTVTKLMNAIGNNVTTSLSLGEIMRLYDISKTIETNSITSLGFTDEPNVLVKTANINGQSVVVPRKGQDDFSEIQSFVRNAMRDGYLKNENASIAVLNGTNVVGLASKRADELKSYGYNVTLIDNAPTQDYASTVLIDFSDGVKKYTKRYLEQRLKTAAVTSATGIDPLVYKADIVIIVGNNENTNP
jgi:LCP family protein required for cell wall assembly